MSDWARIDSSDDPRLEPYREVRERDLVGRQGLFVAEGRVVLEKLIGAGRHPLRSVLVSEAKAPGLAGLLGDLPANVPVYVAAQPVMDAVTGFHVHRGLLAVGERREPPADALLSALPADALVVVLSGVANHDNMGGVFRNAAAFGAHAVLLDSDCCDPLYRKAIRVSVGAALTVPFARLPRGADLLGVLTQHDLEVIALSPQGGTELERAPAARRQAVVFGAEGPGLPADLLARTRTVRIAMSAGFDSLNLSTTSGIVLYSLTRPTRSERSA
jgi:tRNA G18 (ribose-2'-O)-methylase SpoU